MIIEEVTYSIYQFKLILPFVILKLSGYTPGREIDSKDNA